MMATSDELSDLVKGNPVADPGAVTRLLKRWHDGDRDALDALMPMVYGELRRIADQRLAGEADAAQAVQPTELVHEAYLRLIGGGAPELEDRAHFFAISARLMRQILIDQARARRAAKRDGGQRVTLSDLAAPVAGHREVDILDLDRALDRLEALDARKARVIELRVFAGLTFDEMSDVMELSRASLDRHFRAARAWLYRELTG